MVERPVLRAYIAHRCSAPRTRLDKGASVVSFQTKSLSWLARLDWDVAGDAMRGHQTITRERRVQIMRVHTALGVLVGLMLAAGCNDVECGQGTELHDGRCVIAADAGLDGSDSDAEVDAGPGTTPVTCSGSTSLANGECVAKKPIGAACTATTECAVGTCVGAADNLPGGMCTVLGCSMENPCPNGSTCYKLDNSISLCMPYCDRNAACRTDENYHCQPLYTNAVNICAPSCELTKTCSAGTRCNPESGLCEIAQCDVSASTSACTDEETCWPDSKGLSAMGGLCLHLCETAHPEKNCNVQKDEVCQPLESDLSKGFCAPPVCTKNSECPAGAECANHVCQPPATCDADHACADDRTCVSGKCLRKCPTGDTHCSDVHPDLVCADVLTVPACLPLGSFPGSACKPTKDNRCGNVKVGGSSVPMVCENDRCLADCTTGGDALCTGLSASLQCAHGIFSTDLCLPKGSYPGSACGPNNTCEQNLQGDPAVDMSCVQGTCVVGCSESGKWPGYGDTLCSFVDASLTCATAAGSICVRGCGASGACDNGYSCLDPGALPAHENACLPTGSFPGSACRPISGDQCDNDVGGNAAVDLLCSHDTCVVSCPGNTDALCAAVDPRLTCSESASNLCVFACNAGVCPTGYSCLSPSGENACLPTGTFPGSPCRTSGTACDPLAPGVGMECVGGQCVVSCATDSPTNSDLLCAGVNAALTCSESASEICVFACNAGACPTGYSCLSPGGENACLPTGTFPGSPCRTSGTACDPLGPGIGMECVADLCVVSCTTDSPAHSDALCGAVNAALTCSETASDICVFACNAGVCPAGSSCFDPGGENACLPNGTFPGSACRSSGTACDPLTDSIGMECAQGQCVVSCATNSLANSDALCAGLDSALTCSESASDICVYACNAGECPSGYSCLNPGTENACLPNGTFPGSPCRNSGMACDQNVGGNVNFDLMCFANTCVISCPGDVDLYCSGVSSALTCYGGGGFANFCVPKCVSNVCPSGYTCNPSENACLPTPPP
jgi:hypothetical protein